MITHSHFSNGRQQKLATVHVLPAKQPWRGVVNYHHGLGDYALRNEPLFLWLAERGFAVLSFDVHGHGRSEPTQAAGRVTIRTFEHVVDDHDAFISSVLAPFCARECPQAPVFLMGSSMGGASTLLVLARPSLKERLPRLAGAILISAAVDAKRTLLMRIEEPFAALANRIVPDMVIVPKRHPSAFNRDEGQWAVRIADKLLHQGGLKVCTACSILEAFALIKASAASISVPLFALHGACDEVCPLEAVAALLHDGTASTDATLKTFPEGVHDLLYDPERDEARASMLEWLEAHGASPL